MGAGTTHYGSNDGVRTREAHEGTQQVQRRIQDRAVRGEVSKEVAEATLGRCWWCAQTACSHPKLVEVSVPSTAVQEANWGAPRPRLGDRKGTGRSQHLARTRQPGLKPRRWAHRVSCVGAACEESPPLSLRGMLQCQACEGTASPAG